MILVASSSDASVIPVPARLWRENGNPDWIPHQVRDDNVINYGD